MMIRRSSSVENSIQQTGYASCLPALGQQDFISWPWRQMEVRLAFDGTVHPPWTSLSSPSTCVLLWPSHVPHPGLLPLENVPMFSTKANPLLEPALSSLSMGKVILYTSPPGKAGMDNCLRNSLSQGLRSEAKWTKPEWWSLSHCREDGPGSFLLSFSLYQERSLLQILEGVAPGQGGDSWIEGHQ